MPAYRVFLLPCKLSRCLEIDAEKSEVALVVLAHVLDGIDMERHSEAMHWKDNRLRLPIHIDL